MKVKITYQYESGKWEYEWKDFDSFDSAEHYAEKERVNRKAKEYYIS